MRPRPLHRLLGGALPFCLLAALSAGCDGDPATVGPRADTVPVDQSSEDAPRDVGDLLNPDTLRPDTTTNDITQTDEETDSTGELDTVDPEAEDCDNGRDDNGDTFVDCDDLRCVGDPACPTASFAVSRRWKRSWADEFNGPEPGQASCYDAAQTPPQCLTLYWNSETCAQPLLPGLDGLNKCNWSVFDLYNWMDWGKPLGEGVNAFDPSLVEVAGGALLLRARARLPAGGLPGGASMADILSGYYDCGTPPASGYAQGKDCPIVSGGVWSRRMGAVDGLVQTYGRFDVRARLPLGPGSWPAHWMLPQEGDWPGAGEIDIMEATSHAPSYVADGVAANFHDGVEVVVDGQTVRTHMAMGAMSFDMTATQQRDELHVYAVEWEPAELRFYVDGHRIGRVPEGRLADNDDLATGESVGRYPLDVPDIDFYMILNSTISAFGANDYPDPRGFAEQQHVIDYVRAWETCSGPADECPLGGAFDGSDCDLGPLPARSDLFLVDGDLVYPALVGAAPCPDGGRLDGALCIVYDAVPGQTTAMRRGRFVAESVCHETTLPQFGQCPDPCGGIGNYEDLGCNVGSPPLWSLPAVADGVFVYTPQIGEPDPCPIGRYVDGVCHWATIPPGRTGTASLQRHAFYLDATCDPDGWMPNCPEPCPAGARFDGARCVVGWAPPGSGPFVWEGGYYYAYLDEGVYASRCPLGSDDGAHCYVGRPASGTPSIALGNAFVVPAACGNVPRL